MPDPSAIRPRISVICPLYNEEETVPALYDAVKKSLDSFEPNHEIIFVDDGSRDRTASIVTELAAKDSRLVFVRFRRNYGQTPAMAAGIDHATGSILVTMDGDLQNDPRDIQELVSHIGDNFDLVVGWRVNRQDKLVTRKIPSMIANRLIGRVTGVPIKDNGCSLKAYKATVIKRVPLYSELHRFIPAMASIAGARVKQIPVRHHARQFGESKYGLGRIYRVLFDLLIVKTVTGFTAKPLTGFTVFAIPAVLAAMFVGGVTISAAIQGAPLVVWSAILIQLFGLSVFMVVCGAIGELVFKSTDTDITSLPLLTAEVSEVSGKNSKDSDRPADE